MLASDLDSKILFIIISTDDDYKMRVSEFAKTASQAEIQHYFSVLNELSCNEWYPYTGSGHVTVSLEEKKCFDRFSMFIASLSQEQLNRIQLDNHDSISILSDYLKEMVRFGYIANDWVDEFVAIVWNGSLGYKDLIEYVFTFVPNLPKDIKTELPRMAINSVYCCDEDEKEYCDYITNLISTK